MPNSSGDSACPFLRSGDCPAAQRRGEVEVIAWPDHELRFVLLVDDEAKRIVPAGKAVSRPRWLPEKLDRSAIGLPAVDRCTSIRPDLVVLDIMLPGIDRLEVCRRPAGREKPGSGPDADPHDEDLDKILGLELGADDYVTKPFDPRELVAHVKPSSSRPRSAAEPVKSRPAPFTWATC